MGPYLRLWVSVFQAMRVCASVSVRWGSRYATEWTTATGCVGVSMCLARVWTRVCESVWAFVCRNESVGVFCRYVSAAPPLCESASMSQRLCAWSSGSFYVSASAPASVKVCASVRRRNGCGSVRQAQHTSAGSRRVQQERPVTAVPRLPALVSAPPPVLSWCPSHRDPGPPSPGAQPAPRAAARLTDPRVLNGLSGGNAGEDGPLAGGAEGNMFHALALLRVRGQLISLEQ